MQFLMGLNDAYEHVRSNVLSMDPLPSVNKVFHMVMQIERQKGVTSAQGTAQESQAFAVDRSAQYKTGEYGKRDFKKLKMEKYEKLRCEYCHAKGHTKEGCLKLIGYPEWFPGKKGKQQGKFAGNAGETQMSESPLEFEARASSRADPVMVNAVAQELCKLMKGKEPVAGNVQDVMTNFAGDQNFICNVESNKSNKEHWIIDSGATDHIEFDSSIFIEMHGLNRVVLVGLPDGSTSTVTFVGTVNLLRGIQLKEVLFVPNFKHNLLSVSKLLAHEQLEFYFNAR